MAGRTVSAQLRLTAKGCATGPYRTATKSLLSKTEIAALPDIHRNKHRGVAKMRRQTRPK